jgi:hypothetical protein
MNFAAQLCSRWRSEVAALQDRPSGADSKRPCAALAEDRRGKRQGKGLARPGHVGIRKTCRKAFGWEVQPSVAVEASKAEDDIETSGPPVATGIELGGCPEFWLSGVRRRGGVILICCGCMEREKASVDKATGVVGP